MRIAAVWCIAGLALAASASADTYHFTNVTGNNATNAAAGETQLRCDVTSLGANQVRFQFYMVGTTPMSITDVYFDDGTLLGIASVSGSAGVSFSQGAAPPEMPGANTMSPAFVTTAGFSADSDPPAQPNGVNPGEYVNVDFNLIGGQTFVDTINALALGGAAGGLRIGLHVQGFGGGGSESFSNSTVVPLPPAAWAGMGSLAGVMGLFYIRRRGLRS